MNEYRDLMKVKWNLSLYVEGDQRSKRIAGIRAIFSICATTVSPLEIQ
jgi:hypothetical protein